MITWLQHYRVKKKIPDLEDVTGALLSHKMTRKPVNDQIDSLVARFESKRERDKSKGKNDKSRRSRSKSRLI
jgi:hypothetical protein